MRVHSQPAYILHKRAVRDSSQIIEVFSRDHGRLSLVSRGSRSAKSRSSALLQLHRPLLLGWSGRGEMPSLTAVEPAENRIPRLAGPALLSAMYIDELVTYMLHRHDANEELFQLYQDTLYALQQVEIEPVLRLFEKRLLDCLGLSLQLRTDADSGAAIDAARWYRYLPEHGPVVAGVAESSPGAAPLIAGSSLLAYAESRFDDVEILKQIKQLNRHVLSHHLGHRELKSRQLFRRSRLR